MRVATPLARLSRHRVPRSFSRRGSGIRGPSGNGPVKLITRERQSPCRDHSGERDSARARARSFVRFSFSLAPVRSLAIASRIRNYSFAHSSMFLERSPSGSRQESLRRVALLGIEHAGRVSSANMLTVHAPTVLNDTELSGDYDSFARSRARGDLFSQCAAPLIDSFRGSPSLVGHTA